MTIFVSIHFMNEAARCDRISLIDSGRVLATDTPARLIAARGVASLEDAFISYLAFRRVGIDPHPHPEHQLVAFILGLDGFRSELRLARDERDLGRNDAIG